MAARPISASTVSFGLVSLPVKLYSTGQSSAKVRFNWINRETGARIKYQYVDSRSGEPVERDKMVKGYEFAKNQYVTFEPDELKAIEAQATEMIEITEFVPAADIDRVYLERAYYLGPARGGARAYRLLSAALKEMERVAIARYSARGKQRLVMIRPLGDGLILEQLFYPDEVRSFDDVPLEKGEVSEAELALARQFIEQAASDAFNPGRYRDEVKERGPGPHRPQDRRGTDYTGPPGGTGNQDHRPDGGAEGEPGDENTGQGEVQGRGCRRLRTAVYGTSPGPLSAARFPANAGESLQRPRSRNSHTLISTAPHTSPTAPHTSLA